MGLRSVRRDRGCDVLGADPWPAAGPADNLELEQTNEELLELMVKSIEARDPYTSGHSRRVQQYLNDDCACDWPVGTGKSNEIGRAALLHDVGKIYEKYASVLVKAGQANARRMGDNSDHPVDGATLDRDNDEAAYACASRSPPSRELGRHRLSRPAFGGEAIPLAARIIRFADTIDAMTTERPYRRPLTEAQVRAELIRCRATQFDPSITDRLLASALWPTLFAPSSAETPIAALGVVGISRLRVGHTRPRKARQGA